MPRCLRVTEQGRIVAKQLVMGCGCVGFAIIAIVEFGLLPSLQSSENILPERQGSAAPTKFHPHLLASYGPLCFEANQGQVRGRAPFLARPEPHTLPHRPSLAEGRVQKLYPAK